MATLEGQVALVTGGGRGIGANIARELAAAGMRVAVSARTREQVETVAAEIGGHAVLADVADPEYVLGVHLCCRAVIPGMLARGRGRIVITGSGASYLPGARSTSYPASKAAVGRYAEAL